MPRPVQEFTSVPFFVTSITVCGWLITGGMALAQAPRQAPPQAKPATPPPPPPVSADPQSTTAAFGDWVLRCEKVGDAAQAQRNCEIAQSLQVAGQGTIAQIAIGRLSGAQPLKVTVLLPHNISFPREVVLSTDDKDTKGVTLGWRRCLQPGCLADAEVKDEVLRRWRPLSAQGRMTFQDGVGREAILPFSFRGLSQALDALAKG